MSDIFNMADTWNNGATTFTAIKMNVTDTASASTSLILQLQIGGANRMQVRKDGYVQLDGTAASLAANSCGVATSGSGLFTAGTDIGGFLLGLSLDVRLYRGEAGTFWQRNDANGQAYWLSGTYTDTSNYRRLSTGMTTAGVAHIRPEGAGTGASGNVLHISGLPTSNPGPGILWNNAGTIAVGT